MKVLGISWGALDGLVALDVNTCNLAEVECFVQGMQTSLDFEYVQLWEQVCVGWGHRSQNQWMCLSVVVCASEAPTQPPGVFVSPPVHLERTIDCGERMQKEVQECKWMQMAFIIDIDVTILVYTYVYICIYVYYVHMYIHM